MSTVSFLSPFKKGLHQFIPPIASGLDRIRNNGKRQKRKRKAIVPIIIVTLATLSLPLQRILVSLPGLYNSVVRDTLS